MVQRRKIIRRKSVEVEEPEDVEDVDLEDEIDDEDDVDEADEDDEEDEAPAPRKIRAGKAAKAAVAKKVAKVEEPEEDEDEEPVKAKTVKVKAVSETLIADLVAALGEGKELIITRLDSGKWRAVSGDFVKHTADSGQYLRGREYAATVRSPEYEEWRGEWKTLTLDEKRAKAKKVGATWEPAEDPGIEAMRIAEAYRLKAGIEKYKEEYRDRSARAALRGR